MKKMLTAMILILCMALALCFGGCAPGNAGVSATSAYPPITPGNDIARHFYVDGNLYVMTGRDLDTLPEGFELIGEAESDSVTAVGDPSVDFSGNITGYIYMSESDKTLAYFKPRNQNEYLQMIMRNIYFYFEGKLYYHTGMPAYSLPEGFTLAGEVDPEGEPMADFTGNVQGEIYMSESDKTVAYFHWKNWDEALNGKAPYKEPYLRLELRE